MILRRMSEEIKERLSDAFPFGVQSNDLVHSDANSLVQVIERVGDANRHLHSGLGGQFFNGRIALLPEGLRVVLIGQTGNVPLLQ